MCSRTDLLRVAVIGCGVIGAVHAEAIASSPDVIVSAVVSRTKAAAEHLADRIVSSGQPAPFVFESLTAALDHCDAVVVCTPSGTHADLAVAALLAGKHTLIEKPIEISSAGADRIAAASQEVSAGTVVAVVSQHRSEPSAAAVHGAVVSGHPGRIYVGGCHRLLVAARGVLRFRKVAGHACVGRWGER